MKKPDASIDGFIPRRPGSQLGELHQMDDPTKAVEPIDRSLHTGSNVGGAIVGQARSDKMIGRNDIDESLREIDDEPEPKKLKKRRRVEKAPRRGGRTRRIIKWVIIGLLIVLVGVGAYLGLRVLLASSNVFQGNILDIIKDQQLKEDANGRSNFLIFGTAEDDEGGMHGGANLTDSIMVISVDQDEHNAYMISLPRDLWVQYAQTCWVGNQGKLNAVYTCASEDGKNEAAGAAALQQKAGEILGLDIQYYVHLNFTAVIEGVDAIGGVDVTIESSDPRGILDRNFDWKCGYKCYFVNYKNGQTVHLDGEHALALARARNASGGYGLSGGNFDREQNQQRILKALREKAVSVGTLTNLGAVTGLIDTLDRNLRTNIEHKELRTMMKLGTDISNDKLLSLSLTGDDISLVTTGSLNGQSIVRPIVGLMDYSAIHQYIKDNLSADPLVREKPHVTVLNGTVTVGKAQIEADRLEDLGYIVDSVANANNTRYKTTKIYQLTDEKPASATKLQETYGVTLLTTDPPVSVVGQTDFLVIVGAGQ